MLKCKECGENFRFITHTHLKKHNMDLDGYKKKHPKAKLGPRGENCFSYKGRKKIECEECGKIFEVYPSRKDTAKYCSRSCRFKAQEGEGNPFYGESHSEKTRRKMSDLKKGSEPWNKGKEFMKKEDNPNWKGGKIKVECEECGKTYKVNRSLKEKTRFCSKKCVDKWKEKAYSGDNCYNWRGGISNDPYPFEFDKELKEEIREKYGRKCIICGITEKVNWKKYNRRLEVHHIDYNKNNIEKENLVPLCSSCHMKTNFHRDFWKRYFSLLVISRQIDYRRLIKRKLNETLLYSSLNMKEAQ